MSAGGEGSRVLGSGGAFVAVVCITSVLGMLGFSSFAALLPEFQRDWGLSNTDAGWISGIFYAGYVVAVPLLVGSTDRVDPTSRDRKSTRLNSSHQIISYAVFCLKKKKKK